MWPITSHYLVLRYIELTNEITPLSFKKHGQTSKNLPKQQTVPRTEFSTKLTAPHVETTAEERRTTLQKELDQRKEKWRTSVPWKPWTWIASVDWRVDMPVCDCWSPGCLSRELTGPVGAATNSSSTVSALGPHCLCAQRPSRSS